MFADFIFKLAGGGGEVPNAPVFKPLNVGEIAKQTLEDITGILPSVEKITSDINSFMSAESTKSIEAQFPGYTQLMSQYTSDLRSLLKGEVGPGTEDYLQRKGAERAVQSGTVGSGFSWANTTRALGLQSYQNMLTGMNAFERWSNQARSSAQMFNFTGLLPSLQTELNTEQWNKEMQLGVDWLKNQLDAMPQPWETALSQSLQKFDDLTWNMAGAAAGGAMGNPMAMMGGMGGSSGGGATYAASTGVPGYTLPYSNPYEAGYISGINKGIVPNPWQ